MIKEVLKARGETYGSFRDNSRRVEAGLEIFDIKTDDPVKKQAVQMILLKLSRIVESPDYEDNWVDIGGYANLVVEDMKRGAEIVTGQKTVGMWRQYNPDSGHFEDCPPPNFPLCESNK